MTVKVGQTYVSEATGLEREIVSITESNETVVVKIYSELYGVLYVDWKISDLLEVSKLKECV